MILKNVQEEDLVKMYSNEMAEEYKDFSIKNSGIYQTFESLINAGVGSDELKSLVLLNSNTFEQLQYKDISIFEVIFAFDKKSQQKLMDANIVYRLLGSHTMGEDLMGLRLFYLVEKRVDILEQVLDLVALNIQERNKKSLEIGQHDEDILTFLSYIFLKEKYSLPLTVYEKFFNALDLISCESKIIIEQDYVNISQLDLSDKGFDLDEYKKNTYTFNDLDTFFFLNKDVKSVRDIDFKSILLHLDKKMILDCDNDALGDFLIKRNKRFFENLERLNIYKKKEQKAITALFEEKNIDPLVSLIFSNFSENLIGSHRIDLLFLQNTSLKNCKLIGQSFYEVLDMNHLIRACDDIKMLSNSIEKLSFFRNDINETEIYNSYISRKLDAICNKEFMEKQFSISDLSFVIKEIMSCPKPLNIKKYFNTPSANHEINEDEFKFIFYASLGLDMKEINSDRFWSSHQEMFNYLNSYNKKQIDVQKIKDILENTYLSMLMANKKNGFSYNKSDLMDSKDTKIEKLLLSLSIDETHKLGVKLKL